MKPILSVLIHIVKRQTMSAACDEMLRRLQTLDESREEFDI